MLPPSGMKEDKRSLHGKQEQSTALAIAQKMSVLVSGSSSVHLILQARRPDIQGERWTLV